jgi:SAM-dependent methyltransferase/3',5'-cyclic AMP phosphodiesterase CpdA
MRRSKKFRILHLSDFHFQNIGDGARLARTLGKLPGFTSSQAAHGTDAQLPISAVVLSGDFRQQRAAVPEGLDWRREAEALIDGIQNGLGWDKAQRSNILLVPGNHDAKRGSTAAPVSYAPLIQKQVQALKAIGQGVPEISSIVLDLEALADGVAALDSSQPRHYTLDWSEYNSFADAFYSDIPNITRIPLGNEASSPIAYIANHKDDLGVFFVLMHAYADAKTFPDETATDPTTRVQLPATVGTNQLDLIHKQLHEALGFDNSRDHTVIVLHHHLFPMRSNGAPQDLSRRDILTDLPELADRLPVWNTACVLHGHRHRPFLGIFRAVGISGKINADVLDDKSDSKAFDRDYELVTCGIGQALNDEVRIDNGNQLILLPSVQFVDVTPDRHRFFEARVVVVPFQFDRNNKWQQVLPESELAPFASELVLPRIQRELFDAECFAGDQVSLRTRYPLIQTRSQDGPQHREWFVTRFSDVLKGDNCPHLFTPSQKDREYIFEKLIDNIRAWNKSKSIFAVLPFQLAGIYGYASLFFGEEAVHEQAIKEFEEPQWRPLLEEEPAHAGLRPDWLTNHLESANYKIATIVDQHWTRAANKSRDTSTLRVVDLGAGTGRTIRKIVKELTNFNTKVKYRGLEISGTLADVADDKLRTRFSHKDRLEPLDDSSMGRLVVRGEICEQLLEPTAPWFREIDCVVASYCLHHIPNNYRPWKMVADGSLLDIIDKSHFVEDTQDKDMLTLFEAVREGVLCGDVPQSQKEAFVGYLRKVFHWWRADQRMERPLHPDDETAARHLADELHDFLPNRQIQLYDKIFEALSPGGLLIVADPNGFSSTFNRVNIYTDWRMAVAHFAEWTLVSKWLARIGFTQIKVLRQMRLKNLNVEEVEVPTEWIEAAIAGKPFDLKTMFGGKESALDGLEVEDQHLGYIVCATKPESTG